MMEVHASAPGKLVLLGEYAVLEGAPALVMAVNRHARVRLVAKAGGVCEINAPDLGLRAAPMTIGADGMPQWPDPEHAARLRLVDQTLRALAPDSLAPPPGRGFSLDLDTSEFFDDRGAAGAALPEKLGLGSSAALTVALASAMAVFVGRGAATANRRVWLERLLHLHRGFQGGQGSGVDVAASLIGGLISYRLTEDSPRDGGGLPSALPQEGPADQAAAAGRRLQSPRFEPLSWPAQVRPLFVWTGHSASTANFLARLAQWRQGHAAEYAAHMRDLNAIAVTAAEAVAQGHGREFVEAAAAYAVALQVFGAACGLEIFSAQHRRLTELAGACGVGYKPCGAGGGDFGVAFALDDERLQQARRAIVEAGFRCVPLAVDEHGLNLEYQSF